MTDKNIRAKWYIGGLHFDCAGCGNCCAGPDEGYIWITKREIEMLADYLAMSVDQVGEKYLTRFGNRSSIIEEPKTKDCIFLTDCGAGRGCAVYQVRPNQCRTWPFWPGNLTSINDWNEAAQRCPGLNRGRLYSFEEIEQIRKQKKWWTDDNQ